MPRERRTAAKYKGKNKNAPIRDPDGPGEFAKPMQPESPSTTKKRRTNNAPIQAGAALNDLMPPQPTGGFGETIVASNPFDDTVPSATILMPPPPVIPMHHHGMPGHMGPPLHHAKPVPMSSGKIYPPDQPIVFNPQNPNAPPVYPCGICHKEVHDNDQAIICESGCNFWFHRVCTGLTEAAFHLLTAEVYAEWVCDKCLSSKSIPLVKFKP